MPRKKKAADPGFNVFQCQLCADHPQFDQPGTFSAHLTDTHQMDTKAKYQKSLTMHLDATDWYQSDYEWKHDGVTFALQSIRLPRHPADREYWARE